MKIELTHGKGGEYQEQATLEFVVDGKSEFYAGPGEAEDYSLERDLQFVYLIAPLMKRAWEAGMAGEPLEIEERKSDE